VDPFTLLALANAAVSACKQGCKLYKDIKGAAGDVKEVLDDLKVQFSKIPNPSNQQKIQFNEEVQRVQQIAKADPNDTITQIGDHLGKFFDVLDQIEGIFWSEEKSAKQVYKGELSVSRRALQRVLIRSRLDQLQAEIREEMVYNTPPELGDLWTRFEKMRDKVMAEQKVAKDQELRDIQKAEAKKRRMIREIKEQITYFGAVLFVTLWLVTVLAMIRMSHTYRGLSWYVY
jgi:hypothetical protein